MLKRVKHRYLKVLSTRTDTSPSPALRSRTCLCSPAVLPPDLRPRRFGGSTLCCLLTLIHTESLQPLRDPSAGCKKLFKSPRTSFSFQLSGHSQVYMSANMFTAALVILCLSAKTSMEVLLQFLRGQLSLRNRYKRYARCTINNMKWMSALLIRLESKSSAHMTLTP